jgi:glutamine synthetase
MSGRAMPGTQSHRVLEREVVFQRFMRLPLPENVVQAEYVWIGGEGELRCKTRTLNKEVKSVDDLPVWNFDGSSTGQAPGKDSEVYIHPVAIYPDPFRPGPHILVLCECTLPDAKSTPIPTNTRREAFKLFEKVKEHVPWFGIEQEYTLFNADGRTPLGWPNNGYPGPQGPYYCSAGAENSFGRQIVEAHYRACLYAGIAISGCNAEVMAGQWEYQVGPCVGIDSGDQLMMSRYIMYRVCEAFGVIVSFDPKPIPGDWNGAGCHTNFSTKAMREDGGLDVILASMKNLEAKHAEHIAVYGVGNERRLTGAHETAHIGKFSFGVANRGASVRIPRTTNADKKGYFEDRRPASNMDPYIVTGKLARTAIIG